MKTSLFASVLLSIWFYATLMSTMFVMPLVLSLKDAPGVTVQAPPALRDARLWERFLDGPEAGGAHRDLRLPQTDAPILGPAPGATPIDRSGPDAGMIKSGKVRVKTIKA